MKKLTVSVFGVLGVLLLAATGNAAAPQPGAVPSQPQLPPQSPPPALQINYLKLKSVTRAPDVNNVFQIDVAMENLGNAPIKMGIEAHVSNGGTNNEQTADIPGHAVKHFVFADPTGGPPICSLASSKDYTITVTNGGAPVVHKAILHASQCSGVTASVRSDWNMATPDHVEYAKENSLFADNISVVEQPTCEKPVKVKGYVGNRTDTAQNGVKVVAKSGNVTLGSTPVMNIPKGGSPDFNLSFSTSSTVPVKIALEGGSHVVSAGYTVRFNANCAYSAEIDPKGTSDTPPSVPR